MSNIYFQVQHVLDKQLSSPDLSALTLCIMFRKNNVYQRSRMKIWTL